MSFHLQGLVSKTVRIYFDGKCISREVLLEDGRRVTLGVIFPGILEFSTSASEVMEVTSGRCRVRQHSESTWSSYAAGESFEIPANSKFTIEATDALEYVCHYDF